MSLPMITIGLRHSRRLVRLRALAVGVAEAQHEVGRDRALADAAADAVGAEIPARLKRLVGSGRVVRRLRLPHHQRQQVREAVAHLAAVADLVDRAVLEQELGALEAFRQLLAHGLLDHARAGEADQRLAARRC